jgi:hypothetical protein
LIVKVDTSSLPEHPVDGYEALKQAAVQLAGESGDIVRRVLLHHELYVDSGGNHTFPLVALHGALWAADFFETTGHLGHALRVRYFYDATEKAYRMAMLNRFAEGFKAVNRQVFVDTFTNYYFTKHYGARAGAADILHPDLFQALSEIHLASSQGVRLPAAQRRDTFIKALQYEQEVTVAPGVQAEIEKFDCPILRFLCLRPIVHLAYFPRGNYMFFRNFADKQERIEKAIRSYDLAERAGWPRVQEAMQSSRFVKLHAGSGKPALSSVSP